MVWCGDGVVMPYLTSPYSGAGAWLRDTCAQRDHTSRWHALTRICISRGDGKTCVQLHTHEHTPNTHAKTHRHTNYPRTHTHPYAHTHTIHTDVSTLHSTCWHNNLVSSPIRQESVGTKCSRARHQHAQLQ